MARSQAGPKPAVQSRRPGTLSLRSTTPGVHLPLAATPSTASLVEQARPVVLAAAAPDSLEQLAREAAQHAGCVESYCTRCIQFLERLVRLAPPAVGKTAP